MRNTILILTLLIAVTATVVIAASDYYDNPKPAKGDTGGLMSVLKPGQTVSLNESGGSYELTISRTKILSRYKVARIGTDYVVLTSQPKLLDIRIPVTSIKAIIHLKR